MRAWLLTWEGTSGSALVPDRKIIAILSARRSRSTIADLVDVLYCRSVDSAYEMASLANKRAQRERQYLHLDSTPSRLFYGSNPCIFARHVDALRVVCDPSTNTEVLHWRELPVYQNAPSGSGIVERYPAEDREHRRSITPLSQELHAPAA